jgi:hypothetical protein
MLHQSPWLRDYGLRFIQKGLKILEDLGMIKRDRRYGRRTIFILERLRGKKPKTKTPEKTKVRAGSPNRPQLSERDMAAARAAAEARAAQAAASADDGDPLTEEQQQDCRNFRVAFVASTKAPSEGAGDQKAPQPRSGP